MLDIRIRRMHISAPSCIMMLHTHTHTNEQTSKNTHTYTSLIGSCIYYPKSWMLVAVRLLKACCTICILLIYVYQSIQFSAHVNTRIQIKEKVMISVFWVGTFLALDDRPIAGQSCLPLVIDPIQRLDALVHRNPGRYPEQGNGTSRLRVFYDQLL